LVDSIDSLFKLGWYVCPSFWENQNPFQARSYGKLY
jgi:hypothetical protein